MRAELQELAQASQAEVGQAADLGHASAAGQEQPSSGGMDNPTLATTSGPRQRGIRAARRGASRLIGPAAPMSGYYPTLATSSIAAAGSFSA
jgi:hypothetical protein